MVAIDNNDMNMNKQQHEQQPLWKGKAAKAATKLRGFMNHLIARKGANILQRTNFQAIILEK